MSDLTIKLDLPRDLLSALEVSEHHLESRVRQLIAVELFREGRISSGKGAELLGISKFDFAKLLGKSGIAYFTESSEELAVDCGAAARALEANGP